MADTFFTKLNKRQDGSNYAIEEVLPTTGGVFEGLLAHDNIVTSGIVIFTGPQFSGDRVENFVVSIPADTPWKRSIRIFSSAQTVYVSYETPGDIVEADDVNALQTSVVNTQAAVEGKAEKTYVDTQLLLKADKSTTYTKTETDQRIENIIGAAPDALDTLQELATALNNDPNFAASMTTQLAGKVDKVSGKQLSTEDYTTAEKTKLAGVEAAANHYVHPATHPPAIIVQDLNNRFVTDADKTNWNGKQAALGYTAENVANKGAANGYAGLDATGKVPIAQLPSSGGGTGDMVKSVYDTTDNGIVDHAELADAAPWAGITGKPTTFPPAMLTPGQGIVFDTEGAAYGRLFTLNGVPNWVGWTLNAEFSAQGWVLDDPSVPGWFLKLDSRSFLTEFAIYKIPAGAGAHTDEYSVFRVNAADDEAYVRTFKVHHDGNQANITSAEKANFLRKNVPVTWNQLRGM